MVDFSFNYIIYKRENVKINNFDTLKIKFY